MPKIDADTMKWLFNINCNVIRQQVDGLTHEDSLMQLPFRGNCLNWVVGHIIVSRDAILKIFDEASMWSDEEGVIYDLDSDPITADNRDVACQFNEMITVFYEQNERIIQALDKATPELLDTVQEGRKRSNAERIAFLHFHDSYHVGQTEYLRQLAGKNDKVI